MHFNRQFFYIQTFAFDELYAVANDIVQGRLPWYFYQAWNGTSLTALNKKNVEELAEGETMDCHPVCKGDLLRKVITKALYAPFMERIQAVCDPCQFGVGTKGGGAQLTMALRLLIEANLDWVCISLDIKNAFNEIMRQEVLDAIWDDLELRPLWYYNFATRSYMDSLAWDMALKWPEHYLPQLRERNKEMQKQCRISAWASTESTSSL